MVKTVTAKTLLVETLNTLSSEELDKFKSLTGLEKSFPSSSRSRLKEAKVQDVAELMVETYREECVEMTKKVLKEMNRTVEQRWSDISSGAKDQHSVNEQPTLIQRERRIVSVIKVLLERLAVLNYKEFMQIKRVLLHEIQCHTYKVDSWPIIVMADLQDTVFLFVQTYGQKSVEKTKEILKRKNRTDLESRLFDSSSGPTKNEHLPALIHKVATMAALKEVLLEAMTGLSYMDLEKFIWYLQLICFQKSIPYIPWRRPCRADLLVEVMVDMCGQRSVEVTKQIFMSLNRTDLAQRVSVTISGFKGPSAEVSCVTTIEGEKDKRCSALIQKEQTMVSVTNLLLETLADLTDGELWNFKLILRHQNPSQKTYRNLLELADLQDTVFLMVQIYGQKSLEKTKKVLEKMKRTDLVGRLSDSKSGPTMKLPVDKGCSALIQEVATMAAVKHLILKNLNDLNYEEFLKFKTDLQLTDSLLSTPPYGQWKLPQDRTDIVDLIVRIYGRQSVEKTKEVLEKMNKTDLVQKLSDSSSGSTKKLSEVATISKVASKDAVKYFLFEALSGLNEMELKKSQWLLQFVYFKRSLPQISWKQLVEANRAEMVKLMVERFGLQSVEVMTKVFVDINRTDQAQKLISILGSGFTSSKRSLSTKKSLLKDSSMTPIKEKLLETLEYLSYLELKKFKLVLQDTETTSSPQKIPKQRMERARRVDVAELMVQMYNEQSVEVTIEALKKINRSDLIQRLSEITSGSKERASRSLELDGCGGTMDSSMTPIKEKLLETLEYLSYLELKKFKLVLQDTETTSSPQKIPKQRMERARRVDVAELMVQMYNEQSVEVTIEALKKINRSDLIQRLSEITSGSKEGASRSLELDGCGGTMESSNWTKLEPEVNSSDADEPPIYSLQSDAGQFECNVSALRWVCKEKVSLKYQFFSWEEHMERMECLQYMPAGPLMDITVNTGKLDEVYLPHWICIDDDPTMLDKFAVLHIDDCGDVVEKVSEVMPYHVKLSEPVFSPRAALIKIGFPMKIKCNVLIYYETKAPFLKLHVYMIPKDPALQQAVDKTEMSYQYEIIRKPHPDKALKIKQGFTLRADINTAKIVPKELTLTHESNPNFYEVFVENPDRTLNLTLSHSTHKPVWTCEIRKDDYPKSGHSEVDKVQSEVMPLDAGAVTTVREKLLKTLEFLKEEEIKKFKWYLQNSKMQGGLKCIPTQQLEKSDIFDLVDLMEKAYSQQSVEVSKSIFKKMNRNDLVQMLSESSS